MWEWRPFQKLTGVDIVIARIDEQDSELLGDEAIHVASAMPARVREFAAGRSLARILLGHRDIPPKSITSGAGGQPVWPERIVGSISHTVSHVGVAVADSREYRGIGLDVEILNSADRLNNSLFLTRSEMEHLEALANDATRFLSCKEAVFKAVFPTTGENFEFLDVEIRLSGAQFEARFAGDNPTRDLIASGSGAFEVHEGLVASIFRIR